jgi:hypothetical protein
MGGDEPSQGREQPAEEQPAEKEVLPEDLDIFSVPSRPVGDEIEPEEVLDEDDLKALVNREIPLEEGELIVREEDLPPPEGAAAPEAQDGGTPREGAASGDGGAAGSGTVPGPAGAPAEGEASPASARSAEGGPPRAGGAAAAGREDTRGGRGRRKDREPPVKAPVAAAAQAAAEPETAEEEDEGPGTLFHSSLLNPFHTREAWRLPVDLALIPTSVGVREVVAVRFLTKVLHDAGQVPSHLPFTRCQRVAPVLVSSKPKEPPGRPSGSRGPGVLPEPPKVPRPPDLPGASGASGASDLSDLSDLSDASQIVERFGADALRMYLLFAGPLARPHTFQPEGVRGMARFLDRVWAQMNLRRERGKFVSRRMLVAKHRLIDEVTRRLAAGKFHTAVASLMQFVRFLEDPETTPEDMDRNAMSTFILLLSPFAPFLAKELWSLMGHAEDLESAAWPIASEELIHPPEREFLIFVDGRLRDRMQQPVELEPEKLESRALQRDRVRELVGIRKIRKVVVVPRRLVSIALEPLPAQTS